MDKFEQAFRLLPDTVIITDLYWYILDFNRPGPFQDMKKGKSLTAYMPDCREMSSGVYACGGQVFQRSISKIYTDRVQGGYVVYLADITEKEQLVEERRRKSAELETLTLTQVQANAKLEEYIRQAEAVTDVEEKLRTARAIHDGTGHAITALNTISRMCLQLRDHDPKRYEKLIDEGIAICRRAEEGKTERCGKTLRERLEAFRDTCLFPVDLTVTGEEPVFAERVCDVILDVCREAYSNTLSHSMADRLTVEAHMTAQHLTLQIADNGCFRGVLEKGFGLKTMEANVQASGGRIRFEAVEGRGFCIEAEWGNAS